MFTCNEFPVSTSQQLQHKFSIPKTAKSLTSSRTVGISLLPALHVLLVETAITKKRLLEKSCEAVFLRKEPFKSIGQVNFTEYVNFVDSQSKGQTKDKNQVLCHKKGLLVSRAHTELQQIMTIIN